MLGVGSTTLHSRKAHSGAQAVATGGSAHSEWMTEISWRKRTEISIVDVIADGGGRDGGGGGWGGDVLFTVPYDVI